MSASKIEEPGLDQISVFILIINKWNNFELNFSREEKDHVFSWNKEFFYLNFTINKNLGDQISDNIFISYKLLQREIL